MNVAAGDLWKPAFAQAAWSFDAQIGLRPWHSAIEGESFMAKAMELASIARDALTGLREHHRTIALTAEWLRCQWKEPNIWQNYHLGMAFGLSGQVESAQRHFRLAVAPMFEYEWVDILSRESEA